MNAKNTRTPANGDSRVVDLSYHSDEALLQHVVIVEDDDDGVDFPGFVRRQALADGGRHRGFVGFVKEASNDFSVEEFLSFGATRPWSIVFDAFCEIVVADWEETWEICRTAAFTSMLKDPDSARCLALVAWRRRKSDAPQSTETTLWRKLTGMSPDARHEALCAFGRDGAVSCAYEGIDIDPGALAK